MTLKFVSGYWTLVLASGQPIMSFASRAAAQAALDDLTQAMAA